jgi:3alpha(or 20beta)-hydroxysteroid dehydrogenase
MFSLNRRIALVSGSARGIGRETARALARQGVTVFAADILEEELNDLAARSREENLPIRCVRLDVTSPEDWARVADQVGDAFEQLDILVNNAGVMDSRSFFDTELEDFRKTMRVNMEGMFIGAKAMLPLLRRGGQANPAGASVINICSTYGACSLGRGIRPRGRRARRLRLRPRALLLVDPPCHQLDGR